ncbi:MAG TPA: S8 family serine peptidase, partial [Pyrinomonadaceae bacterium]|nr:S8 family serine peptidase [Pyrinomonadaceae bacterium]
MIKRNTQSRTVTRLTALLLLCALSLTFMGHAASTSAQSKRAGSAQGNGRRHRSDKVSSDLRERMRGARPSEDRVKVILQLNDAESGSLASLLKRNGIRVKGDFKNFGARAVELPASVVEELASHPEVEYISTDRKIEGHGHITSTTGADAAPKITTTTSTSLLGLVTTTSTTSTAVDGTGVGIAILDSGIWSGHHSFEKRIVASQDFTGEKRTDDPYGHGTHVASMAAASKHVSNGAYSGIAPNAKIINLRVLNSQGSGTESGVISALDWVMTNRAAYNIRVVNMSLGAPAIASYKDDPLCKAVRRLVDAGIVVVAAAGNNGKDDAGQKIYGRIHSPGNEPSAITVGATNTFGTDVRRDDT